MWDLSSPTRDRTRIPCIGRRILYHWTTGEVPVYVLLLYLLSFLPPPLSLSYDGWGQGSHMRGGIDTGLPLVYTGHSVVYTGLPVVYTGLPVVCIGLPVVYSGIPVVCTGPPVVYIVIPMVYTGFPVVYTGFPVVSTGFPMVCAGLPNLLVLSFQKELLTQLFSAG